MSSTTFNAATPAEQVAAAYKDLIQGKNIVITGVSPESLGAGTVEALAPYAETIIVTGRSITRTQAALSEDAKTKTDIRYVALDLTSGDLIRKAADEIKAFGIPIHVLINNAGLNTNTHLLSHTVEGFESQMGGNHFGHFLFTYLLFPTLLASQTPEWSPRVVTLSSFFAAYGTPLRLDDLDYRKRPEEYDGTKAYQHTKTMNIMFAKVLGEKYGLEGVFSFSVDPGVVRGTNMGGRASDDTFKTWGILQPDGTPNYRLKTISEGSSPTIYAAFSPDIVEHNGAFISDNAVFPQDQLPSWITDYETAHKLWTITEDAWKIKFGA